MYSMYSYVVSIYVVVVLARKQWMDSKTYLNCFDHTKNDQRSLCKTCLQNVFRLQHFGLLLRKMSRSASVEGPLAGFGVNEGQPMTPIDKS